MKIRQIEWEMMEKHSLLECEPIEEAVALPQVGTVNIERAHRPHEGLRNEQAQRQRLNLHEVSNTRDNRISYLREES
jgi:hypothetical protein